MSDSGALAATKSALAVKAQVAQGEETVVHTRILRLALGIEESRAYWTHVDPTLPAAPRAIQAFEQRWFGAKSLHRVRTLLANFAARYDACPDALSVLRRWRSMDPEGTTRPRGSRTTRRRTCSCCGPSGSSRTPSGATTLVTRSKMS